ncbi:MAG: hypothetical protein ACW99A_23020 [Candidatus Kariarchaeaceae archaeon]|jgi:pyruvate/2-oxoglutarate dehydrogenase complex dihydrolipoamide dehydrogenase (E3) component
MVDENFNTNITNIWAIGDVTGMTDTYDAALEHATKIANQFII